MSGSDPSRSDRFLRAARTLQLDVAAAEIAAALEEAGVGCIVLRGPSLTRWLYPTGRGRNYLDVDLLVPPDGFATAESILEAHSFVHVVSMMERADDRPIHARTFHRPDDSAVVDLHRTIIGARVTGSVVWDVVRNETEPLELAGGALAGLNAAATALIVALHATQHGKGTPQPLDDLRRALDSLPRATWVDAHRLAARVDATESFGVGLRLVPEGQSLADELGVPAAATTETVLRADTAPPTALGFEWLAHVPGRRAKARLLAGKLAPDKEFMLAWSPLARRGRVGLALVYLWRPLWLVWHTPRGFLAWAGARKRAKAGLPLEK